MNKNKKEEITEIANDNIVHKAYELELSDEYDTDEDAIKGVFEYLKEMVTPIEFGNYLKRVIARKIGWEDDSLTDYTNEEYTEIILKAFADNNAPYSFSGRKLKKSEIIKEWLGNKPVSRDTVFAIGFGLKLTPEEVAIELLNKGLAQPSFNFCNYKEIIYWYCYKFGLEYNKAKVLINKFLEIPAEAEAINIETREYRESFVNMNERDDAKLIHRLLELKKDIIYRNFIESTEADFQNDKIYESIFSRTAYKKFTKYYEDLKKYLTPIKETEKIANMEIKNDILAEVLTEESDKSEINKTVNRNNAEKKAKSISEKDETYADVVFSAICASVKIDAENASLIGIKKSSLPQYYLANRLDKSRFSDIINKKIPVNRTDLIILRLMCFEYELPFMSGDYTIAENLIGFKDNVDEMLKECSMAPFYPPNPFDNFILMCLLTASPSQTYHDIIEYSYGYDVSEG